MRCASKGNASSSISSRSVVATRRQESAAATLDNIPAATTPSTAATISARPATAAPPRP